MSVTVVELPTATEWEQMAEFLRDVVLPVLHERNLTVHAAEARGYSEMAARAAETLRAPCFHCDRGQ